MKALKFHFFIFLFIGTSYNASCQQIFQINESRILKNENLDFFIKKLENEKFTTLKSKKEIPSFIKKQLPWLSDSTLADFNETYQEGCVVFEELPARKVTFLAKSEDVFIVSYVSGGFGTCSYTLLVFYSNKRIIDVWVAPSGENRRSVSEILTWINKERHSKHGIHSNILLY